MRGRVLINNLRFGSLAVAIALLPGAAGLCCAQEDPKELTKLAHRYQNGIDGPRDIGKALLYYKKAAEANEPGAMLALGDLYREGVCVNRDIPYSLGMFKRAADLGSAEAMTRYGDLQPGELAVEWFTRAAEKGYGPAMTRLGDLLDEVDWYRKAVQAGDPPAFAKLAARETTDVALKLLEQGAALKDPIAMRMLAHRVEGERAAVLFRSAAESGDAEAMEYHARNSEAAGELGDALMWYSKAAELGRPRAKFWMQQRAGDVQETIRIAAAKAGDPEALFQKGEIQKAADLGHPEALARLGRFEEAAGKGHPLALFKVGRIEDAARAGHPEAMRRFGESLTDKADGMLWIKRAAEAGDVVAMRGLGLAYRSGKGIAKDPGEGKKWLEAAAGKGDTEARLRLREIQPEPRPVPAASAPVAVAPVAVTPAPAPAPEKVVARKSAPQPPAPEKVPAEANTPEAKYELAGRTKKATEAYKLYLEAANAGFVPAMIAVGDCHMNARGTWRSEIDAVNWYRRAAQAGSAEALATLARLGKTL